MNLNQKIFKYHIIYIFLYQIIILLWQWIINDYYINNTEYDLCQKQNCENNYIIKFESDIIIQFKIMHNNRYHECYV